MFQLTCFEVLMKHFPMLPVSPLALSTWSISTTISHISVTEFSSVPISIHFSTHHMTTLFAKYFLSSIYNDAEVSSLLNWL